MVEAGGMVDIDAARRIAATYPPEARCVPRAEREAYLTETQQLAWLLRFHPKEAAEVLSAAPAPASTHIRADRVRPRAHPHRDTHHG